MNINEITILLEKISQISKNNQRMSELLGENFNIFKTLKLESAEVRMHSAFLTEFLNPKGTHGQGGTYLRLFIDQFSDFDSLSNLKFDIESASSDVEKYIGQINIEKTEGGRLDILVEDKNNNKIIIENKIYAKDQENQLLRYWNHDKKSAIFYLTLDGSKPNTKSLGGKLKDDSFRCISYTEIISWLDKCKKESVSLPIIRETLSQYINLIKYLTHQTTDNSMKKEIIELILKQPEYIESIESCHRVVDEIKKDVNSKFKKLMEKSFHIENIKVDEFEVKASFGEDGDGIWLGYYLPNPKEIEGLSPEKVKEISNLLLSFLDQDDNVTSQFSNKWLVWYFFEPLKRYERFINKDNKLLLEYYEKPDSLKLFVDDILKKETKVRENLKRSISLYYK